MLHYASKADCLRAKVWQALDCANRGASFQSNTNSSFVWQKQFPNCNPKKATCETKSMYLACYDIVPYVSHTLRRQLSDNPHVLFDEILNNRELQKKQVDLMVRFWKENRICTLPVMAA